MGLEQKCKTFYNINNRLGERKEKKKKRKEKKKGGGQTTGGFNEALKLLSNNRNPNIYHIMEIGITTIPIKDTILEYCS